MIHRHLTTTEWSRMAIESLFDRGTLADWREFVAALRRDDALAEEVLRVCAYREPDGAERIARVLIAQIRGERGLAPQAAHEPAQGDRAN